MFEINFHRETLKQKRRDRKRQVKSLVIGGIYVALLALFTGIFTLHVLLLRQNISAKEEELSKIEGVQVSHESGQKAVSMDQLLWVSQIKGGQPRWGMKLQALSSMLRKQMWLTEIYLTAEKIDGIPRDVLQVSGTAYVTEEHNALSVILDYLNALRDDQGFSKDFENIKLLSSRRSGSSEREELNFKFVCLVRR